MRISDWSSDVCSSDLAFGPEVGGFRGMILRQPENAVELDQRRARIAPLDDEIGELRDQRAVDPPGDDRAGDERRSEEHTSELQSLMRISYAVFCLKKKKQNNNDEQSVHVTATYNDNHQSQQ